MLGFDEEIKVVFPLTWVSDHFLLSVFLDREVSSTADPCRVAKLGKSWLDMSKYV